MAQIVDSRGRLFGRLNLVDLLVLLVIIALVAFAFLRFSNVGAEEVPITTTFRVEHVRDPTIYQIKPGDQVQDEAGVVLGTVKSEPTTSPSVEEYPPRDVIVTGGAGTAQGDTGSSSPEEQLVPYESTLYKDVDIVVEGSGQVSAGRVAIGPTALEVGSNLVIVGPAFKVRATIWGVDY